MINNLKIKKALFSLFLGGTFVLSGCNNNEPVEVVQVIEEIKIEEKESVVSTPDISESSIEELNEKYSNVTENMYVTSNLNLRKGKGTDTDIITVIDKCQKIYEIKRYDDWSFIKYGDIYGFVHVDYIKELPDTFIEVDISEQNIKFYLDNNIILDSDIVTGTENVNDTRIGMFSIYSRETKRYLQGRYYVDYWMPFDGGIGLHDAGWRDSFGDEIYKTSGSHGCVNLPLDAAQKIYKNSHVGTNVIVHK